MKNIEFNYNSKKTIIQCTSKDKIKDIFKKFSTKIEKDLNSLVFLYGGKAINEELILEDLLNNYDKENETINIIVADINGPGPDKNPIIKSKEIICPICKDIAKIDIIDYKIYIECKNGHNTNNIFLDKYEETQKIDQSKIICDSCKENNMSNTYNNEFYICTNCNMSLCPLCLDIHKKQEHNVIKYEQKNFYL